MKLKHTPSNCALVALRIACDECGYPQSEAMFDSVEQYEAAQLIRQFDPTEQDPT